jgi:hypothetical protein
LKQPQIYLFSGTIMKGNSFFLLLAFLHLLHHAHGGIVGLAVYGACQTGCNAAWVPCVAAAGGIAGVATAGVAIPAAVLACSVAQGACMAACAAMALSPV